MPKRFIEWDPSQVRLKGLYNSTGSGIAGNPY
jgi:hypothetical protein